MLVALVRLVGFDCSDTCHGSEIGLAGKFRAIGAYMKPVR